MVKSISPAELRHHWVTNQEIALLDIREEGPYALSHPLFALSIPISEIEIKLPSLVPRLSAPIVIYDDGENYVSPAASRITKLGYTDISILEGGLSGYARVGEVYRDVNVPSKAFGELVESITHTPSLSAREVKNVLDSNSDIAILDARRFEEFNTMSIPSGRSCPGGELLYRVLEAVPSPETTVIVNCAGRTRSILGTQSLVNSRIPNRVVALRNGTIGWTLEGLDVDTKRTGRAPVPSSTALRKAKKYAEEWAEYVGVSVIGGERFGELVDQGRTVYLLDVRDPEEYALGHLDGFVNAPGGQLVQATDEWVGVRGAQIFLYDTDGVRARMTATWLLQLGWEVYVLDEGFVLPSDFSAPSIPAAHIPQTGAITIEQFQNLASPTVVDLARSPVYRKGHIPGAWHVSGPELARDLNLVAGDGPIVLTSPDGDLAAVNIEYARSSVSREVFYLQGGTAAWVAAGNSLEIEERWLAEPIDVYKRPYEGTSNAQKDMQAYLDWEYGLIAQLANDGVSRFHVVRDLREKASK